MVIGKSGGNDFHGTLFEFIRNEDLNARNYFAQPGPKPEFRRNQYGLTVGGPIRKNKTFFFADWQGTRLLTGSTRLSTVPTVAQRGGVFTTTIYDPGTLPRTPFANNTIPDKPIRSDRIAGPAALSGAEPAGHRQQLCTHRRRTRQPGSVRRTHRSRLQREASHLRALLVSARRRHSGDALARWQRHTVYRGVSDTPSRAATASHRSTTGPFADDAESGALRLHAPRCEPVVAPEWRHLDSRRSRQLVSVHAAHLHRHRAISRSARPPPPTPTSRRRSPSFWIRSRWFADATRSSSERISGARRWTSSIRRIRPARTPSPPPARIPPTGASGNALASLLLGQVNAFSIDIQNQALQERAHIAEFFVGRRLEGFGPAHAEYRHALHAEFPFDRSPQSDCRFQPEHAGARFPAHRARDLECCDFGPRVGLAYRIGNSWVIRSGYGMIWFEQTGITTPFTCRSFRSCRPSGSSRRTTSIRRLCLRADPRCRSTAPNPNSGLGQGVFGVDRNVGSGYSQQWNFTVQKTFGNDLNFEVGYLGSKNTHLGLPESNLNQLPAAGSGAGIGAARRRSRIRITARFRLRRRWDSPPSRNSSCCAPFRASRTSPCSATTWPIPNTRPCRSSWKSAFRAA